MSNIIRAFLCDEDEVLTTEAAFIGFQVLARSRGVKYRTVPYRDWHYDLPALAARDQRAHQDHLPGESQQSHRHHLHAAAVRRVLPPRAGARADHSRRGLFRVRQGQSALSGFHALPLRQRDHAAHVFEDLRPGRRAHRLRLRARGTDPQSAQGEAAVRAVHAGAGGRNRGARRQGVSAPLARAERARPAVPARRRCEDLGHDGGAFGGEFRDDRPASEQEAARMFRGTAGAGRGRPAAGGLRPAALPAHFHRHGRRQPPVHRGH